MHFFGARRIIQARISTLCSFAVPFLSYNLGGRIRPVLAGYKITNKCNLKCVHCPEPETLRVRPEF